MLGCAKGLPAPSLAARELCGGASGLSRRPKLDSYMWVSAPCVQCKIPRCACVCSKSVFGKSILYNYVASVCEPLAHALSQSRWQPSAISIAASSSS